MQVVTKTKTKTGARGPGKDKSKSRPLNDNLVQARVDEEMLAFLAVVEEELHCDRSEAVRVLLRLGGTLYLEARRTAGRS